ncbi:MAG: hypothetical protein ACI8RD_008430 [Bacillariaceae sp.]|jgi:hypothetical protein
MLSGLLEINRYNNETRLIHLSLQLAELTLSHAGDALSLLRSVVVLGIISWVSATTVALPITRMTATAIERIKY